MANQDFRDWESSSQIDPMMLRLLQKKYEDHSAADLTPPPRTRRLGPLYAAFLGVGAMVLVILLGVVRGIDVDEILANGSRTLLLFCLVGFIAGKIAEMCVNESAKLMLHEMLRRTDQMHNATVSGNAESEFESQN